MSWIRVTGFQQKRAWLERVLPDVEEFRAGIWSIPVPIPNNPLRYTLTYAIHFGSSLVVVDPGWDSDEGWQALSRGLNLAGCNPQEVTGIVTTHVHPDHHGLTARLREASDAWVAMHPLEAESLPARLWHSLGGAASDLRRLQSWGLPPEELATLSLTDEVLAPFLEMSEPDILLDDGQLIPVEGRRIRAVWTPGHTPGHLCLYEEGEDLLFTGDHVLPRISPNIDAQPGAPAPPLDSYLSSLDLVTAFDGAEAAPAHEYRFLGISSRVTQLRLHHEKRCNEIEAVVALQETATIWEIARALHWSQGWKSVKGFMRRAALSETAAHLELLRDRGLVIETLDSLDVKRYSSPTHRA